jgi:hypothetical protein
MTKTLNQIIFFSSTKIKFWGKISRDKKNKYQDSGKILVIAASCFIISEMPIPSQGHYAFPSFPVVD